ncbi:MAG TPA: beta-propeller fold lactonase family protein [Candidatus Acidoferrales bacterium]|nr:beta-propeller fold lactonase family protein [Candidatus Acidoferrales bacterium]
MQAPAKSCKVFLSTAALILLISALAGQAFADTKPKFVYVTNSGAEFDTFQTFSVTGTASCSSSPCASTFSVTGSFSLDLNSGSLTGTVFLADPSDLAGSPTAFPVDNRHSFPTNPFYFRSNSQQSTMTLAFSPNSIPGGSSGGTLCTTNNASGCASLSTIIIASYDMSDSLRASTGGISVTATFSSGSITMTGNSQGAGTVSAYAVDANTGVLTLVPGSPFSAGLNPYSIALDPSSKFVYVANRDSNNVSAYAVNSATGALTPVSGSPFAAGLDPNSVAVDPTGKFVYVANQRSNTVSAFTLDSETGALNPVNGAPFPTPPGPTSLTIDPAGKFIYVTMGTYESPAYFGTNVYSIDPASGALNNVPGSAFYAMGPLATAIDPTGKFLFESFQLNPWWGTQSFLLQSSSGLVTAAAGCNSPCPDTWPSALAVHPSGKFLYVTDPDSSYVSAETIDTTTGKLGLVPGSPTGDFGHSSVDPVIGPYATGAYPNSIAIDPAGKFAYVANMGSNNISAYTIDGSTGALAPMPGSPFIAGIAPSSLAIASAPASVAFDAFKVKLDIDEDRKTTFRADGFFTLGAGSDGIYPLSESVTLQVGSYTVNLPAGSFRERGRHEFTFEGSLNDVDLRIRIYQFQEHVRGSGKETVYLFTAEGRGNILKGTKNPVAVGLTIGDDEGNATVRADIDK